MKIKIKQCLFHYNTYFIHYNISIDSDNIQIFSIHSLISIIYLYWNIRYYRQ